MQRILFFTTHKIRSLIPNAYMFITKVKYKLFIIANQVSISNDSIKTFNILR